MQQQLHLQKLCPGKNKEPEEKNAELDDFDKCAIRHIIQSFYVVKKEIRTINKLWLELKADIDFKYGRTSLRSILKTMGYKYKKCQSKRKILMERNDIAAWRAKYILRLRKNPPPEMLAIGGKAWYSCFRQRRARWIIAHAGGKTGFIEN